MTYFPNSYPKIRDCSPAAVWTDTPDSFLAWTLARKLGDGPFVIKDHIKSAKHLWHEACFAPRWAGRGRGGSMAPLVASLAHWQTSNRGPNDLAHAICGIKTNIVTAVEIGGRDAADSPFFKPLVEKTAQNFTIEEVPADKAYLSHDNLALVDGLGGTAFVPYKVIARREKREASGRRCISTTASDATSS